MSMSIRVHGNYNDLERCLKRASKNSKDISRFAKYGEMGLQALIDATPVDSGLTASSWGYSLSVNASGVRITWTNSNVVNHVPIAIILDVGHATKSGGYVSGKHFIDPALQPVFDKIAKEMRRELME